MGDLTRTVLITAEEALPRGRLKLLRIRLTIENIVTAAFVLFAVASSVGYQVMRRWASRSQRP
jgi:hypothetical protein